MEKCLKIWEFQCTVALRILNNILKKRRLHSHNRGWIEISFKTGLQFLSFFPQCWRIRKIVTHSIFHINKTFPATFAKKWLLLESLLSSKTLFQLENKYQTRNFKLCRCTCVQTCTNVYWYLRLILLWNCNIMQGVMHWVVNCHISKLMTRILKK